MEVIFAVLFIIFSSSDLWFTTSGILFAIAIISWLISAVIKRSGGDEDLASMHILVILLSSTAAVIALVIGLIKLIL